MQPGSFPGVASLPLASDPEMTRSQHARVMAGTRVSRRQAERL